MTHQPLAIPHKETELFGGHKNLVWGVLSGFTASAPFSFHKILSRTPLSGFLHNAVGGTVLCRTWAKGKKQKKNFPIVNWQKNVSKGYTPPTHSFPDDQRLTRGHGRRKERAGGAWKNFFLSALYCKSCWIRDKLGFLLLFWKISRLKGANIKLS